jgi:hypothetical protein
MASKKTILVQRQDLKVQRSLDLFGLQELPDKTKLQHIRALIEPYLDDCRISTSMYKDFLKIIQLTES